MNKKDNKEANHVKKSNSPKMSKETKIVLIVLGIVGFILLCVFLLATKDVWLPYLLICGSVVVYIVYACYEETRQTQQQAEYYRQDFANRLMIQLRLSCFTIFNEVAHIANSLKVSNIDMLSNLSYQYSNNT